MGSFVTNFFSLSSYLFKVKFRFNDFIANSSNFISSVAISLTVVSIALGTVLAIQLGPEFVSHGLGNHMGILSAITMTRELIPIVGSFIIATQYGTGFAAEIANMKITEQIDALKVFQVSPIFYLVIPRFLAVVVFAPLLLWLNAIISVASCYITLWLKLDVSLRGFLKSIVENFKVTDISIIFIKSIIFGAIIILTATTIGLETTGGAKEVGKSTTKSVILSFIIIIVVDYIITAIYL